MINRILSQGVVSDLVSYRCNTTYVKFEGLEEKTQARLLTLGYSPAIQCDTPTRCKDYGYDLSIECARGGLCHQLYECPYELRPPKIVHRGDLDEWLAQQVLDGDSDIDCEF